MAILAPGTFKVSDYRKPIPVMAKLAALVRAIRAEWNKRDLTPDYFSALESAARDGEIQFDHRPPLQDREYDTEAGDFIPPQHEPAHLDPILPDEHLARSTGAYGRPERGDADRRKRVRSVSNKHEDFVERQKAKAGQTHERRTDIPVPTKGSQKPKAKIRGRGFQKRPKPEKVHKKPARRFS